MSTSRRSIRSTTGCTFCKTRRKKCDEAKPQCRRCLAAGRSCTYDFVEYPESESHRVQRTKPAPRSTSEREAKGLSQASASPSNTGFPTLYEFSIPGNSTVLVNSVPTDAWNMTDTSPNLGLPQGVDNLQLLSTITPVLSQLPSDIGSLSSLLTPPDTIQLPIGVPGSPLTPGSTPRTFTSCDPDEDDEDDNDPEGVQILLWMGPTMDRNVKENSLPFVLHCYSQWAVARVFEPMKVVHALREQVIAQFSSQDTRRRTILIANVMIMFAKHLVIDATGKSILNHLVLTVRKSGSDFMATPPSFDPAHDRQNAMRTLDSMLEMFSLQTSTQSSAACLQLLDDAAPVFRRACLEPPGQRVNLASILLTPSLNLRHFATIDIMRSINTGRPTYFPYEVPFSLGLCEKVYQMQGTYGLQWLHGAPDQFILLFGWINSLCTTPGATISEELVTWVETNLPLIKVAINESSDPSLHIGRMVVQECWRISVRIYLYMVLCGASACDSRVVRAQKACMRLLRGVKSGRHPDAYLYTPILVTGVVTTEDRDRDTIRRRILNVRECAEKGTTGNDILVMLEDIWARTKDERRAAVWTDLRIANDSLIKRQLYGMSHL